MISRKRNLQQYLWEKQIARWGMSVKVACWSLSRVVARSSSIVVPFHMKVSQTSPAGAERVSLNDLFCCHKLICIKVGHASENARYATLGH